jgi:hypothetical protein
LKSHFRTTPSYHTFVPHLLAATRLSTLTCLFSSFIQSKSPTALYFFVNVGREVYGGHWGLVEVDLSTGWIKWNEPTHECDHPAILRKMDWFLKDLHVGKLTWGDHQPLPMVKQPLSGQGSRSCGVISFSTALQLVDTKVPNWTSATDAAWRAAIFCKIYHNTKSPQPPCQPLPSPLGMASPSGYWDTPSGFPVRTTGRRFVAILNTCLNAASRKLFPELSSCHTCIPHPYTTPSSPHPAHNTLLTHFISQNQHLWHLQTTISGTIALMYSMM